MARSAFISNRSPDRVHYGYIDGHRERGAFGGISAEIRGFEEVLRARDGRA